MGVIIDLDLTLVDSQAAESLRRARRWPQVYELIPQFTVYDGIHDLVADLTIAKIPICVVTSSPRSYCERTLKHFEWTGVETVCYHDTTLHKPNPAPILLALKKLQLQPAQALSVGDDPKDTSAAKAAGVFSVGALWGAPDRPALIKSRPDVLCETVAELRALIFSRFANTASNIKP